MATLDEYAYNIRNIAKGGQGNSDDNRLSIKQIKFWINSYRASGIAELTEYGKMIDPTLLQDLGVVPLSDVDAADSTCPDVQWGCTIKKVVIPKLIDLPNMRGLNYVGKIDKITPMIVNYPGSVPFKKETRFGNLLSRVYLIGNTLYFLLSKKDEDLEYVNIRGLFEQPEKVIGYPEAGCSGICYDSSKDDYPMSLRLYEYVTRNILSTELGWTEQSINDELNNARQENEKLR